ncbi:glycosyl transferase [Gordonia spumicola]|uniref:Glycosyl transferase n=1 Tax=Gordonia spumicola TaxID=589161 RepID=A0A7I9V4K3_9ACTN|nr:glycosyltransferase family 4 protein [Gordonia spumicola]GEE00348.1 glycosyl transferase [Gordonia spumicola]
MRIVHLVNDLADAGNGIINVAVDLACEQARTGHDVTVMSRGGEYVDLIERFGARHVPLPIGRRPADVAATTTALAVGVDRLDPDVVHSHTLMLAGLAYAVRTRAAATRGRPRYRLVTTVHNEYQRGVSLMGLAHMTVSVSHAVDTAMARRRIPVGRRRVVHNGTVGTPRRRPAASVEPAAVDGRMIVVLGAVSHRKGSDVVVDAFTRLADDYPDASVWFVGNPDWTELVDRVAASPLSDRIRFAGLNREPATVLRAATMMVLASRHDPFPLVLLEAKEAGLPIIGSAVDGVPEALDDGASGLLFPAEDVAALETAMRRVLDDPAVGERLVAAGDEGLARYSAARMSADYVDVYLEQIALGAR